METDGQQNTSEIQKQNFLPFNDLFSCKKYNHQAYFILGPVYMLPGHFAERHFAERHFAERHFAERTFCPRTLSRTDILSNGQYDERTFRRKDNFAETTTSRK